MLYVDVNLFDSTQHVKNDNNISDFHEQFMQRVGVKISHVE